VSDKPLAWLGSALPHDVKLARERYRALLRKRAEDAKKK
jgi:hypothetical protein